MKKSWFHFSKDILSFGILPPIFVILLVKFFFENKLLDISDSLLSEVLDSFKPTHVNSIIVLTVLIALAFASIRYCLWIGYNRQLYSKNTDEILAYYLLKFAFATIVLIVFTIVLTEKQFMIATGWLAFFILIKPLFIFKNPNDSPLKTNHKESSNDNSN